MGAQDPQREEGGGAQGDARASHGAVLVTGGTGTLGRAVARRLLEGRHDVRVLSRRPRSEADRAPYDWAVGDLLTGSGIDAALEGARTVIHCATTLGRKDVRATRRLIEAAERAGGPHLVYISIVGVDRVPLSYYGAKLEAERLIEASRLPWSVLRATQFHALIARMTAVQRPLPCAFTLAGVHFQPVDEDEVAGRLVELALGEPAGRAEDMGGPLAHSARELTALTLRAYGRRRPVLPLRLPGKAFRGYRAGGHLAPHRAVGRVTYAAYLDAAGAGPGGTGPEGIRGPIAPKA